MRACGQRFWPFANRGSSAGIKTLLISVSYDELSYAEMQDRYHAEGMLMMFTLAVVAAAALLFLGTLALLEIGQRLGHRHRTLDPTRELTGLGVFDGAVFTLLGLLLAFTFAGAASRFETRRDLVGQEANEIGTAYLRIDVLAAEDRAPLRALFRDYLDARIDSYRGDVYAPRAVQARERTAALQGQIWSSAVTGCMRAPQSSACMLLLPSINSMFDITTTRLVATWNHPPLVIHVLLVLLTLVAGLLSGYGTAENPHRSWLHRLAFAGSMAGALFVILDLEYPRLGLIRVDAVDQVLVDLRQSFGE